MHLDFIPTAREDRRAAARAKVPPLILACFPIDNDRLLRKDRCGIEQRAMMLAASKTMAKANPIGLTERGELNPAAQASTGNPSHAAPFPDGLVGMRTTDPTGGRICGRSKAATRLLPRIHAHRPSGGRLIGQAGLIGRARACRNRSSISRMTVFAGAVGTAGPPAGRSQIVTTRRWLKPPQVDTASS